MASKAAASSKVAPNTTLYIQNLNTKIRKPDLRRILYCLFSSYGKILDVVATRAPGMRGQAFIVFRDLASSTAAMRGLDGEKILEKDIKITYARTTSHSTILQTSGPEAMYAIKSKRISNLTNNNNASGGEKPSRLIVSSAQKDSMEAGGKRKGRKRGRGEGDDSDDDEEDGSEEESDDEVEEVEMEGGDEGAAGGRRKKRKRERMDEDEVAMEEDSDNEGAEQPALKVTATAAAIPAAPSSSDQPYQVLFIEGLPREVTDDMLAVLFQQYPGFQTVRLVASLQPGTLNSGLAFVQYDTPAQAEVAKLALDGFQLAKGVEMKVGWAKRG